MAGAFVRPKGIDINSHNPEADVNAVFSISESFTRMDQNMSVRLKIRFGQARERKQLQWRESFNVFSGVGFRCGSKRGKKNVVSMVSHTFG